MVIEFKKQSLFERFGLSVTSKADLMRQFQSQPELRKNLPLYIKTLNDEKQLYAEELFTTAVDGSVYTIEDYLDDIKIADKEITPIRKYVALLYIVRNFSDAVSKIKLSGKIFDDLITNALNESNADGFKFCHADQNGEIYRAVLETLWSELENAIKSIVNEMDIKNTNSLHRVIKAVSDEQLRERFLRVFGDSSATLIDTLVTRIDNEALFERGLEFISGLGAAIFKDKTFYTSYKYFAGRLTEAADEHGFLINKNFTKVAAHLKKEDAKKLCDCLEAVTLGFLSFENIGKYAYKDLADAATVAERNLQYITDNALECEHRGVISSFVAIITSGEAWFDNYKTYISAIKNKTNLSSNLFEICQMIALAIPKKEDRIVFYNMIAAATDFQSELMQMITRKERYESVVSDIQSQQKYMLYSTIKSQIGSEIPTPQVVDLFILNYYALTILDPETKKFFNVMKQVCFTAFALIEHVPEQRYGYGYGGLTPKGEFMKDIFMEMPNDWEIEGAGFTVKSFLSSKLSVYTGSNYGDSKSKAYVAKCDKATTAVKKTTPATTAKSTVGSTLGGWKSTSQSTSGTSGTSSKGNYRVPAFGVIAAICAIVMIIGFATGNPALGVAFLILAGTSLVAFFVGKKIVDKEKAVAIQNKKALVAIILIPIILLCSTVIPIAVSRNDDGYSSRSGASLSVSVKAGASGRVAFRVSTSGYIYSTGSNDTILYNAAGTMLDDDSGDGMNFRYYATSGTTYYAGSYQDKAMTYTIRASGSATLTLQSSGSSGGSAASTYTVTFNKASGSGGTSSVTATYGDAMPYATAPTRNGYTFGGYYSSANGAGTQYYTASMTSARTYNLSTNTTLYAKWTQDGITLTPSNFSTYFNLSSSCSVRTSSIGYTTYYYADYTYSITPKAGVNQFLSNNPLSISVTIGLDISSFSSSYGTPSEYKIYVTLYKPSGYKASGSQTYSISSIEKYWDDGIYSVSGTIYG